jgi:hypothetical protein
MAGELGPKHAGGVGAQTAVRRPSLVPSGVSLGVFLHGLEAASAEGRVLVTIDLDFANPLRFPPASTAGIAVLRDRDRSGRGGLDAVVPQLITGLKTADIAGHL